MVYPMFHSQAAVILFSKRSVASPSSKQVSWPPNVPSQYCTSLILGIITSVEWFFQDLTDFPSCCDSVLKKDCGIAVFQADFLATQCSLSPRAPIGICFADKHAPRSLLPSIDSSKTRLVSRDRTLCTRLRLVL